MKWKTETSRSGSSCFSPRVDTLVIGFVDIVLGLIGILSFLVLDVKSRHAILFPFTTISSEKANEFTNLHTLDQVGESYQFLLEFWLPSVFLFILGIILISAAALNHCRCLALLSFVLSTLFVAGCLAAIVSLFISQKVGFLGFVPLLAVTLTQIYFYIIVGTFWLEAEARRHPEDKEMLVISTNLTEHPNL